MFAYSTIKAQNRLDSIAYSIGTKIDESLNEGDPDYLTKLFNENQFLNKFILHDDSNDDLSLFNNALKKNLKSALAKKMISEIEKGTYYNFINYYTDIFNNYYLIFRMYGDEGLNYHEYHLLFDKNKNPYIGDMYVMLTGELFSETISRIYYPTTKTMIDSSKVDSNTLELINNYEKLAKVFKYIDEDNKFMAWLVYSTIPEKLRDRKNFLIAELRMVDIDKNEEKYIDILKKFNNLYPNDPSWYLLGIDMYFLDGDYESSLSMIDSLELETGDSFLNFHRGNIYFQTSKYKKAQEFYSKLISDYPFFEDGVYSSLMSSMMIEDYDDCVTKIELLIKNFGYTKQELVLYFEDDNEFEMLEKSEPYLRWRNREN